MAHEVVEEGCDLVAELGRLALELRGTSVHVADDVEWAVIRLAVVPQRLALQLHRCDRALRLEDVHVPEPFPLQVPQRALELAALLANDVRTKGAIRPVLVARLTEALGEIEHDR